MVETKVIYKNWKEICKCESELLRLLLSLEGDQNILERLQKGFPQYFSDEKTKTPRVPASVLKERAREYSIDQGYKHPRIHEYHSEMHWYDSGVLDHFGIPCAYYWYTENDPVPAEILRQLVGKKYQSGNTVTYRNRQYVVTELEINVDDENGRELHTEINQAELESIIFLALTAVEFIDLDH